MAEHLPNKPMKPAGIRYVVAMCQVNRSLTQRFGYRLLSHTHAQLLFEIFVVPGIVIAYQVGYVDAGVAPVGQEPLKSGKATRYQIRIFDIVIKDVSEQEKSLYPFLLRAEERDQVSFNRLFVCGCAPPEMDIREK